MSKPDVQHFMQRMTTDPPPTVEAMREMLDEMLAARLVTAFFSTPDPDPDACAYRDQGCPECAKETGTADADHAPD